MFIVFISNLNHNSMNSLIICHRNLVFKILNNTRIARQASVTRIVQDLGWRTLDQRRADARLCLFYKIVHGLVAVPLPEYIQYSNRVSRYCHSMTFRQVSTSTDYYKYSFFPLAIVQWNALPQSVASSQSLEVFKTAVCKLQHSRP